MGGFGSGEWYRWEAKTRAESCIQLDACRLAKESSFELNARGSFTWSYHDAVVRAKIGYSVRQVCAQIGYQRIFQLDDCHDKQESISIPIALQKTVPLFGGVRWWFTCPLSCNGVPCGRRVRKLYLKGKYFGCRTCHQLTYESCQESHKIQRIMDYFDRLEGVGEYAGRTAS